MDSKPHGHGDIHQLLYNSGTIKRWKESLGIKWIAFFQDTNSLAFTTLACVLGVSKSMNFTVNSVTVPRKAKQAVGSITKLIHSETKEEMTINVSRVLNY